MVAQVVVEQRHNPESLGFDSRWAIVIYHWLDNSGRTVDLRSFHHLPEMFTRNISWGIKVAGA